MKTLSCFASVVVLLTLATVAVAAVPPGSILVSSYRNNEILELDGATGNYIGVFAQFEQSQDAS